jgi:hypothetical protein
MHSGLTARSLAATCVAALALAVTPAVAEATDRARASSNNDVLTGGSGRDVLHGRAGNDRVRGRGGPDHVSGGSGNDRVEGGAGADEIDGGDGQDRIDAGPGDDQITGDAGNDTIRPGPGADLVYAEEGSRNRVVAADDGDRDDIWCVRGGASGTGLVIYVGGRDRQDALHGCRVRVVSRAGPDPA